MLIALSFGCKKYLKNRENVQLDNFNPLTGVHCESSALLNALNHQGYDLTEDEILGAGAVLGFVYQKGQFPFLGGRTLKLKENLFKSLDINWHLGDPSDESHGWNKIHELLKNDTPVVLRVDMRYLTYLYDGKYGSKYTSFGWHIITLVSIDVENQVASVTDTAHQGLQKIKLKDLDKARFSKLKIMPPKGEFYWMDKAPANYIVNWEEITYNSLQTIKEDMLKEYDSANELIGLNGMKDLSNNFETLGENTPSYLQVPVLGFLYGSIETNGTGGAAFRDQYLLFLKSKSSLNKDFQKYSELLNNSVLKWDQLSDYLNQMANNKDKRDFKRLGNLAQEVYLAEKEFYTNIK